MKYVYRTSIDDMFLSELFDTKKEAIDHAVRVIRESGDSPDTFEVGVVHEQWKPEIDGNFVIEHLADQAYDECDDGADGYLENLSEDEISELGEMLTQTYHKWEKKHHVEPNFYVVENVEKYEVFLDTVNKID